MEKQVLIFLEKLKHIQSNSQEPETNSDFEDLFRSNYSDLCAYANRFLKDLDASEDVVQEVFIKLWKHRNDIEFQSSQRSYLFRAVRNGCLNVLKHIDIRETYKLDNERLIAIEEESNAQGELVSDLEKKIRQTIDLLPMERRRIFVMSRYDGLKYKEIAEKLNISPKTVENQIGKALKFMRESLKDYLPLLLLFFTDLFKDLMKH